MPRNALVGSAVEKIRPKMAICHISKIGKMMPRICGKNVVKTKAIDDRYKLVPIKAVNVRKNRSGTLRNLNIR